jgi:hypothetical protein
MKRDDMRQDDVKQGKGLRLRLGQATQGGDKSTAATRAARQLSSLDDNYPFQTTIHKP